MTSEKTTLKNSLSGFYSSGRTSFSAALRKSIDILKADISGFERTIILMSDGEDSTNLTSLLTEAKNNNIKIHTICLSKSSSYDKYLKNISDATGGEFYKVYTSSELVNLYKEIGEEMGVDLRDTDGDGLADVYEIAGMRLINGQIVYSDPYSKHSDNDGLEDGEEILPELKYCEMNMTNMTSGVPEIRTTKGYYFEMISDPNKEDTDGDGIPDNLDPWIRTYHNFDLLKNYILADEWGAKIDESDKYYEYVENPIEYYDTIVIHHTVRNINEDIKSLQKNEISDGFNGIPYHYVINGKGVVYETRPIIVKGEHCSGKNTGKVGIALMGNFEPKEKNPAVCLKGAWPTNPTKEQLSSMELLIKIVKTQYVTTYLGGHRYWSDIGTACPGQTLYDYLEKNSLINLPQAS